ncbi:MAG TPA: hypothetical protein VFM45_12820 [Anaeromyxobacteraceae bacterium]|nr:hypothetical protein [Anaeromyxobacteraceae bacterium]
MTRAAVVSAIAFAIAACGPAPVAPFTDATVYWNFQDMDGNVFGDWTSQFGGGCVGANVDQVRVSMTGPAGSWVQTVPCLATNLMPGATFTNLPAGPYTWTLEALRQNLTVFSTTGGGDIVNFPFFYATLPAVYPNMDLFYDLPVGGSCAQVAEIAFVLRNLDAGIVEYSSDNVLVTCRPPPQNGFTMPSIPVGNYGYRFVSAIDAGGFSLYQVCGLGFPPQLPLVQSWPNGNAYTAPLAFAIGTCP